MPPPIGAGVYVPIGGGCRDVAGDIRTDSGTGVLLSADKRREVLVRIGGSLYNRAEDIEGHFNMARRISGMEGLNETIQLFCNKL